MSLSIITARSEGIYSYTTWAGTHGVRIFILWDLTEYTHKATHEEQ
jgi:hypothetical protein